ncbi:uncharacterized protein LOC128676516 [Plodia interpunctella]|uniref:uncharacterized protein LOC128676516 n=1 Tax=Plodia interpunctella TaxID=58824 RepID=UPI002367D8C8|nr:uncharacterized protein LOC128676516 [Plodia interpunctella]
MGIHCQINLFKPSDGAYLTGSTVSGIIKYGVDQETIFDKITVSLKGSGNLILHDKRRRSNNQNYTTHRRTEDYVDIDNVIVNEKQIPHDIGMYETRFDFKLPDNIPSSLDYYHRDVKYRVKCKIVYYIRIKFERPGFLQFANRFRKELTVISRIKPTLLNEPIMYGQQKKLFQLFSRKNSTVNIKASVETPVIRPGGKINLDYEVANGTNLTVKGVEIKLVELYTFTTVGGRKIKIMSDIDGTDMKTSSIKSDEKQNLNIVIVVPSDADKTTFGHSNIVSRDYFVKLTTEMPFPHIDAILEIPMEIGDVIQEVQVQPCPCDDFEIGETPPDYDNPPPSYWEAMGEDDGTKDDEFREKS